MKVVHVNDKNEDTLLMSDDSLFGDGQWSFVVTGEAPAQQGSTDYYTMSPNNWAIDDYLGKKEEKKVVDPIADYDRAMKGI